VSVPHAADYFDKSPSTMQLVYEQLRESGFFKVLGRKRSGSYIFVPVEHRVWVTEYPNGAPHAGACCKPPSEVGMPLAGSDSHTEFSMRGDT
jgi:hypothetical protein